MATAKNNTFLYRLRAALRECVPPAVCRGRRRRLLDSVETRPDRDEIISRAGYCCRLVPGVLPKPGVLPEVSECPGRRPLSQDNIGRVRRIGDRAVPRRGMPYWIDAREYLRYFDPELEYRLVIGDVFWVPEEPSLVKARPIACDGSNAASVLLNLNKVRHFYFPKDPVRFEDKTDTAVFRGKIDGKTGRELFFEKRFGDAGLDIGGTDKKPKRPEWAAPALTVAEQLRHKFILSIEGNDVASNLKWIFASDSLPVMPRPKFETWFLEGALVPGVHYIEIEPDGGDLAEKLALYSSRPDLCAAMNEAEHEWVARFRDPLREKLVSLLVLDRYFAWRRSV